MIAYLGLGTNLGAKADNLLRAIAEIEKRIGSVVAQSSFLQTAPWGFDSENDFLNAAVAVETHIDPFALLDITREIERDMGREGKSVNGAYHDRIIDIDILVYGDSFIDTPQLKVPHPFLSQRLFVLEPLAEIAPSLIPPRCTSTVEEMKRQLT